MAVKKIGIDLGTCSLKYCTYGSVHVYSEPCIAAVDLHDKHVLAYGEKALSLEGRNSDRIKTVRIMQDGVIINYALAKYIISDIVDRVCRTGMFKPVIGASIPCGISGLDKKTMLDVLYDSGASKAYLIEEPVAAVFGAGIADDTPKGRAILDIGGGSSDCAVITMNSVATSGSIGVAGNSMTNEIISYLKENRGVEIGFHTAENLKKVLANAIMRTEEIALVCGGKKQSGEAVNFEITTTEMRYILKSSYEAIRDLVISVFNKTAPDLIGDIAENGIILTGGSAEIYGLAEFLSSSLGVPVALQKSSGICVAVGVKKALHKADKLAKAGIIYSG